MAVLTFRGGVHPARNKKLTASKPAKDYYPKGDLSFPLYLHHGLHAKPVVKGGEWVSAGTLIAEAEGYVSANVHSVCKQKLKGYAAAVFILSRQRQRQCLPMADKPPLSGRHHRNRIRG